MKRMLPVLIVSLGGAWLPALAADDAILRSFHDDYARIEKEMQEFRTVGDLDENAYHTVGMLNNHAKIHSSDRDPFDVNLRRVGALLEYLEGGAQPVDLFSERAALAALVRRGERVKPVEKKARRALFVESRALARTIALKNPLLKFDQILFNTFEHQIAKNNLMNHDQDVGYSARAGGGIGVIRGFMTDAPTGRNLLAGATIANGPDKGRDISRAMGSFNSYDLSFDGKRLVFAWSRRGGNPSETWTPFEAKFWTEDNTFHLFTHEVGSKACRQITFGNRSDHSPCWLPGGRIVFMSERRNTTARCASSRHQPTSTMHSVKSDGSDLIRLSWHDTEEWDPSVANDGMLVYTRWDYLDRDFHEAHHLWTCYPDGRDPRAPHGNYPLPHTTLEGDAWSDGRALRPWGEYNIRAIPGSTTFVAIAGGHHSTGAYGSPIVIDISQRDDYRTSQVRRITPGAAWINEAYPSNQAGGPTRIAGGNGNDPRREETHYGYPWPLSESFHLVMEASGDYNKIYLLDVFGNREMLYSGFEIEGVSGLRIVGPRPFRARWKPPVIPTATWQGERDRPDAPIATISVMNVYDSDFDWPEETKITSLRVIQHIPRPWSSPVTEKPRIGYAQSPTGRLILGTAPVEADGSAYFEAPVGKLIYFQSLDEKGMAVQSMRSGTYVHPGEQLSCIGCHEDKWRAVSPPSAPLAMRRAPSKLTPDVGGVEPINFYRLVQPVLEAKCLPCHRERNAEPDFSYASLEPYAFYFHADGGANHMSYLHGGSKTIAGKFGARWSRLHKEGYLNESHYDVRLTDEERRRITLWLDANSLEMPTFSRDREVQARARRGELVWPALDVDPNNPVGVR